MYRVADQSGELPPQTPRAPDRPPTPKVKDYYGRMVEEKRANRPYLAYQEFRKKQEERRAQYLTAKAEHAAAVARGENPGPAPRDPDEVRDIGWTDLLRVGLVILVCVALAGKVLHDSFLWGYEGKWTNLKTYWPSTHTLFSEERLRRFDGTKPDLPIYLAIDHDVYDVTPGRHTYGPGGSYHVMAGQDVARAFGTGCFKEHQTHDLRGLTQKELDSVQHWKEFFANHKKYFKVGRVVHPPIDPASPIVPHCKPPPEEPPAGPRRASGEL